MLTCFTKENVKAIPIIIVQVKDYLTWLEKQDNNIKNWLKITGFQGEACNVRLIPDKNQNIQCVILVAASEWDIGILPLQLPQGVYTIDALTSLQAIIWGLGAYQFTKYKKAKRESAKLFIPEKILEDILPIVNGIYLTRNLINMPADDMGPKELSEVAKQFSKTYHAAFHEIIGNDLLKENYPAIHTVGRASDDEPRLIDIRFGNPKHPKVTLIGKGVCFDTGGLDLKASAYMLLMKKDMGGAAHVLGLATMIIEAKLPIYLRVLIPAVENSVSGNAYRPGDIIKSRKGLTIEIGNTDAEGRLVLADALTESIADKPDLIIDISTLTGAARVALGTDLPVVFTNRDEVFERLSKHGKMFLDEVWRLPLYQPYREYLNSTVADINNNPTESYGAAISAALFLETFIDNEIPWIHIDLMAWNLRPKPGKPQGGEAQGLRALFAFLKERYLK